MLAFLREQLPDSERSQHQNFRVTFLVEGDGGPGVGRRVAGGEGAQCAPADEGHGRGGKRPRVVVTDLAGVRGRKH
jgi:hypothetical protein